ncbi:hypothetical protein MNBD_BACTEROID05-542 [hydrothermal vent metagenome]|uniref:GIY-YIG domain-containing protein n=1 Tax=hydrothermal vent metagenome TaxID=652676 RepID=A0A3B0TG32_9ZZZZ
MAYVYILESLKNGRYYIGCTSNLDQRIKTHQSGAVKYTKNILPVKLVFKQEYANIDIALKIEKKLKSLKRKDYISKIIKDGHIKVLGD